MLLLRSSARSGDSDSPRGILNSAAMLALSPIFKIEISPARWVCLLCLVCLFLISQFIWTLGDYMGRTVPAAKIAVEFPNPA